MSNSPANEPSPSSSPQPEQALSEVRAAFSRANMGCAEVRADSNRNIAAVEELAKGIMFDIGAEAKRMFTNSGRQFEMDVLSRRASGDEAAILYSPTVTTPGYDDRSAPTKTYFLPPWQTLHPEILNLLGRPDQEVGSGAKKVRIATSQSYQEGEDGLVRSRVGIMFKTDESGELEQRVMWSTPAFIEVATRLQESFAELSGKPKVANDPDLVETPDGKIRIEDLKLGGRRRGTGGTSGPKPLDLDTFLDRSPNYLAGLIGREIIGRINADSREQDLIKDPSAFISDIKLRENWDISVKMTIGGEKRELVISRRNPEVLSFDWADQTASVVDFTDADVYMPKPEVLPELDHGGFPMEAHPPADTIEPSPGDDKR